MKNLIRLTDFTAEDIREIFRIADELEEGKHAEALKGKCAVLFFPETSIRTRVTYEKGIWQLGGQAILFSAETLNKREKTEDVIGYLNNWADVIIARCGSIELLEEIGRYSRVPVINAMSDVNHPCEVLSDLYALQKMGRDIGNEKYLFCGKSGNIGLAWKEASEVLGFSLEQCCPDGWQMEMVTHYDSISEAIRGQDIIITDSLPSGSAELFDSCRITAEALKLADRNAVLDPCPPFYRGEEVSADAIASEHFAGYEFKKYLLKVQQAIILFCLK